MHVRSFFPATVAALAIVTGLLFANTPPATAQAAKDCIAKEGELLDPISRWECNTDGTKIVGGWKADLKYWPGFAALRYKSQTTGDEVYVCGGVMIEKRWMLTAAHCLNALRCGIETCEPSVVADLSAYPDFAKLKLKGPAKIEVVAGVDNLVGVKEDKVFQVVKANRHKIFGKLHTEKKGSCRSDGGCAAEIGSDIALVEIKEDYKGEVALLSSRLDDPHKNFRTPVMIAGFGRTLPGRDMKVVRSGAVAIAAPSHTLLETMVPTIANEQCQKRMNRFNGVKIFAEQICATDEKAGDRDTCQGDSGGPLVAFDRRHRPFVVGLTSFGIGCGTGAPGVYTRVSSFRTWIENVTALRLPAVMAADRVSHEARDKAWTEARRYSNKGHLVLGICSDGDPLKCRSTSKSLPVKKQRLALKIKSGVGGKLVVFVVTLDGRVDQLFPRGGTALAVERGSPLILPHTRQTAQESGLAYGWDFLGGRLVGVVLPAGGNPKVRAAEDEIKRAATADPMGRRAGLASNGESYLKAINEAIGEAGNASAVTVLDLRDD